ncbi:uncharacterized protein LOC116436768 isoform X1 [Corvus moneduloides]|uniref:uncharacterized protein LOC116436768 isoform X1 n=2 Tax=Corvus moneduloides TaxID=1196302 RepID=UPI001362C0F3|nr:uncharacterized protein LOC116436768 isoform X1 [Corvus moneduloides]
MSPRPPGRARTVPTTVVVPSPLSCPGVREMEELFLQLWAEVARLQELCSEQGRLLQRLRARKGPVLDIPVSLPIQCTEDAVTGEGQRSPESHQNHPGAPTSSASNLEGSAHPMEQPQAASRLPLSPGNGVGTGGAAAFGSTEGEKGAVPTWMRTWILPVPREGGRAPCSPRDLETLNPGAEGSFLNLLDLYEAPGVLEREDAPRDGALPVEAPVEIRGPVKVIREAGGSCGIRDSSSSSPSVPDPREVWQSGVIALKSLWAPSFLVPRGIGYRNPPGSQPGRPSRDPGGGFEDPLEESAGGKALSVSFGSSS